MILKILLATLMVILLYTITGFIVANWLNDRNSIIITALWPLFIFVVLYTMATEYARRLFKYITRK